MKPSAASPQPTVVVTFAGDFFGKEIALLGALALPAGASAAVFAFNATSSGTWTADDSAAPLVTLAIDHPTVTASGFSFAGLAAQEAVDTSAGGIF